VFPATEAEHQAGVPQAGSLEKAGAAVRVPKPGCTKRCSGSSTGCYQHDPTQGKEQIFIQTPPAIVRICFHNSFECQKPPEGNRFVWWRWDFSPLSPKSHQAELYSSSQPAALLPGLLQEPQPDASSFTGRRAVG